MQREVKVGLLVVAAFAVLGIGTFVVSERKNLFTLKNRYSIEFGRVGGLAPASPVQLDGVTVGSVSSIVLPEEVEKKTLTVWISIDRRYAERIRDDSVARIKSLGLLGDKFIDISSGSSAAEEIPVGGVIPAAPPTDVDRLIATGGDAVDNVMAISYSLRTILERMEAGEGLLGELTSDSEVGRRAKNALVELLESIRRITLEIEQGDGSLARLIKDDSLIVQVEDSLNRLDGLLAEVRGGEGIVPALLADTEMRRRTEHLIANLGSASARLDGMLEDLRAGDGLIGKMIGDDDYAEELTRELKELIHNLNIVSERVVQSEGTLGLLISDPQVYEAINDVIVGIDESWMLRWLIRNRQKEGIEQRFEVEKDLVEQGDESIPENPDSRKN